VRGKKKPLLEAAEFGDVKGGDKTKVDGFILLWLKPTELPYAEILIVLNVCKNNF